MRRGAHVAAGAEDAVGEGENGVHVMFDQHDGMAPLKFTEQIHHHPTFFGSHTCHGFVEEQQFGIGRQGHGEFQLPLFSMTEA